MDWVVITVLVVCIVGAFMVGGILGYFTNHDINTAVKYENNTIKRENERLNSELRKLTDRDSKGRFTGGK
jgi:hypothetical protein